MGKGERQKTTNKKSKTRRVKRKERAEAIIARRMSLEPMFE
jgi:hypothetical protein